MQVTDVAEAEGEVAAPDPAVKRPVFVALLVEPLHHLWLPDGRLSGWAPCAAELRPLTIARCFFSALPIRTISHWADILHPFWKAPAADVTLFKSYLRCNIHRFDF